MRQRAVRLPVIGATAQLGDRLGQLVNLSVRGALLKLDAPALIGGEFTVVLMKGAEVMRLPSRVVRATPAPEEPPVGPLGWFVAVEFLALSSHARSAMPRLVARIPSAPAKSAALAR
jgi:hypothetical protein